MYICSCRPIKKLIRFFIGGISAFLSARMLEIIASDVAMAKLRAVWDESRSVILVVVLVPTAYCLLPTAYCLLPIAYP